MRIKQMARGLALMAGLTCVLSTQADVLRMKNGNAYSCKILATGEKSIFVKLNSGEEKTFPTKDILQIATDEEYAKEQNRTTTASQTNTHTATPTGSPAKVQTCNGILVFTECTPKNAYVRVGTMTGWRGKYDEVKNKIINKMLQKYPEADGIVLNYNGTLNGRAIKFSGEPGDEGDRLAYVKSTDGYDLYIDCLPEEDYNLMGSVMVKGGDFDKTKRQIIKAVTLKYPHADGIIIRCNASGENFGTAIRFKK